MKRPPRPKTLREQIERLLPFLAIFEEPSFSWGTVESSSGFGCYPAYSDSVMEFIRVAYDAGWVEKFDWGEWSKEAHRLFDNPRLLWTAEADDLRRLLTTHMRQERFSDGHLAHMIECGHIVSILRRLRDILEEGDAETLNRPISHEPVGWEVEDDDDDDDDGDQREASMPSRVKFKPYPAYRDSGIEWLGEVPEHWCVRRLKFLADTNYSSVDKDTVEGEAAVRLCNYVDVYYNDWITSEIPFMEATASSAEIKRFLLKRGDVLITKDSESWDDIAVSALVTADFDDVLCGYHLAHIRPKPTKLLGDYLSRAFATSGIADQFKVAAKGIIRYGLSKIDVDGSWFPEPPLDEQRLIAAFLDRETARIDALVAKKQRLIELLEEKRTALISHAVTKGLDPNAPMKDSGVEWLGEVPRHWELACLKRRARKIQAGSTPPTVELRYYEDGSVPWHGPSSFSEDIRITEPVKMIAERAVADGVARLFAAGSILIGTIGSVGKVGLIEEASSCNQQITVVTLDSTRVLPLFAAYQMKRLEPVLLGIAPSTTLPILDQQEIGGLPLALPPLDEQVSITAHIETAIRRINTVIQQTREQISLLQERRTALISAAVRGKIDVREVAA